MKTYFPIFLDLRHKPCLVVGGGEVGEQKLQSLVDAGAKVTLVSPEARPGVAALAAEGEILWQQRKFRDLDLEGQLLVIAATDDPWVNHWIFDACNTRNILVNVVDDIDHCGFIVPSIVSAGPVQVAVSTSGTSPTLARELRKAIARELVTEETGNLALFLARWREKAKLHLPTFQQKKAFWDQVFAAGVVETFYQAGRDAAASLIQQHLDSLASEPEAEEKNAAPVAAMEAPKVSPIRPKPPVPAAGRVTLVGAGPGAADLLTLRAKDVLAEAEVVLYDRLVNPELLRLVPTGAERIFVGKRKGEDAEAQQQRIHALMTGKASQGRHVVRLKGGDPFVFGRGGEELAHLTRAGVKTDIVPGISSCIAAPEAAGIPVTYRGIASSFGVFTGHPGLGPPGAGPAGSRADCSDIDWEIAARLDTAVFLMGVARLPHIVEQLLAHGRPDSTPIAVIHDAYGPKQHNIFATLGHILALRGQIHSPATIVVGHVASLPGFPLEQRGISDGVLQNVS